jgi:Fe2+ or Zn2+ uptake regulation protein
MPDTKLINSIEFLKFMIIIEKRLSLHNQILTTNKKLIIKILFENSEHLSVNDIVYISANSTDKKLDTTTVYRILLNFKTFGLVDSILFDDN